jgi:hypothetical protein
MTHHRRRRGGNGGSEARYNEIRYNEVRYDEALSQAGHKAFSSNAVRGASGRGGPPTSSNGKSRIPETFLGRVSTETVVTLQIHRRRGRARPMASHWSLAAQCEANVPLAGDRYETIGSHCRCRAARSGTPRFHSVDSLMLVT